jgi:hypothetical protein
LAAAAEKYFSSCEKRGLDSKTIRKYRASVDPFVQHCGVTYVDECRENKQPLLDYMGWLRKQPVPKRKNGNPERTLANKADDVRIFLKEFGVTKLLKKNEEPGCHEKKVVAHTDEELGMLYGHARVEDMFLLDFFIGTMARDHEAYRCRYRDLTGTFFARMEDDLQAILARDQRIGWNDYRPSLAASGFVALLHVTAKVDQDLVVGVRANQSFARVLNIENDVNGDDRDECKSEYMHPTAAAASCAIAG